MQVQGQRRRDDCVSSEPGVSGRVGETVAIGDEQASNLLRRSLEV
jgi:hypothetical protein